MDIARCQGIAEHLHTLLLQRLGMGLDTRRMLTEPLYARDVLLVCAAHPGTELAELAWAFRDAARAASPEDNGSTAPAAANGRRSTSGSDDTATADHQPTVLLAPARPAAKPAVRAAAQAQDEAADSQPPAPAPRSPLSRFSRLSLSRFSASIFGGSLFEGTLFGRRQPDPQTDFGDESFIAPPAHPPRRIGDKRRRDVSAAPRRSRWFGR